MQARKLSKEDAELIKKAKMSQDNLENLHPSQKTEERVENFIELSNLPSRGLFYRGAIEAQPLKVNDLLQIQTINKKNSYTRFNEIFSRRVRGILPEDIMVADEMYLALWLREQSFPGYLFPHKGYKCSHCKKDVQAKHASFNWGSLSFESNIDDVLKNYEGKGYVEFNLPKSGKTFRIVPKKRIHAGKVQAFLQQEYYQYGKEPSKSIISIINLIVNLEFGAPSLKDGIREIEKLDAIDFIDLVKNINKNSLSCGIVVNQVCPNCKEGTSLKGYPFRPSIYFPIN